MRHGCWVWIGVVLLTGCQTALPVWDLAVLQVQIDEAGPGATVRAQPAVYAGDEALVVRGRRGLVLDLREAEVRGGNGAVPVLLIESSGDVRVIGGKLSHAGGAEAPTVYVDGSSQVALYGGSYTGSTIGVRARRARGLAVVGCEVSLQTDVAFDLQDCGDVALLKNTITENSGLMRVNRVEGLRVGANLIQDNAGRWSGEVEAHVGEWDALR